MPNRKSPPATALVIGGGVIGLTVALTLQQRGLATTLVDPGEPERAASWGNAGHIAVEQVEPLASGKSIRSAWRRLFWRGGALALPVRGIGAWLPFSLRMLGASRRRRFDTGKAALRSLLATAMPAWRHLLARAGAPELLREDGHFIVWESAAGASAGRAVWAAADTGTASFRDAAPEELAAITGLLGTPPAAAIRFSGSGQIADLPRLASTLTSAFERAGGTMRRGAARALAVSEGTVSVALDGGEHLSTDVVVVAAGFASAGLLRPLGHKVPLIAERGYHLQSTATWPADLPPLVFEERSMIVTRFASGLRAASFVEFTCPASPPDPRKWARLRSHVRALGLNFAEPVTEWMGVRPTFPDYLPAIGKSRCADNLYYAFGHQHLGLTLAATTAEMIATLACGDTAGFDAAPFGLERFSRTA